MTLQNTTPLKLQKNSQHFSLLNSKSLCTNKEIFSSPQIKKTKELHTPTQKELDEFKNAKNTLVNIESILFDNITPKEKKLYKEAKKIIENFLLNTK